MRYVVKENPQIFKIILLAAALNLFMTPFFIIGIPYILRITMNSGEVMYGIGMGIIQLSTILGALSIGVLSKKLSLFTLHRPLFLTSILIVPMAIAVSPAMLQFGYWPSFVLFFTSGAAITLLVTAISIFVITSVQMKTPNEMLGKVMAIIMAVSQCAAPFGQAMYGFAFEQFKTVVYIPVLMAFFFTAMLSLTAKGMLSKR